MDTGQRQRILARGEVVAISRTIRHRARCAHPAATSLVRRAGRAAGRAAGGAGPARQGARAAPLDAVEQFVRKAMGSCWIALDGQDVRAIGFYERHGCPETGVTAQEPPSGSLLGRVVPRLAPMRAGDLAACPWPPATVDRRRAGACQCSTLATDRESRPEWAYGRHVAVVRSTAPSGHTMSRPPCQGRQRWVLQSAESS